MKKILTLAALALVVCMMAAVFAACGGTNNNETQAAAESAAETTKTDDVEATAAETGSADGTYRMIEYVEDGKDRMKEIQNVDSFNLVIEGDKGTWVEMEITLKDGKLFFTEDGEDTGSPYKLEGNKLTIYDPENPENYCIFEKK